MASELAKEIAELCGIKIHYAAYDTKEQWPTYIPSGKPVRTHSIDLRPIPEPNTDRAACMELITYVSDLQGVGCVITGHTVDPAGTRLRKYFCAVEEINGYLGDREILGDGYADTQEEAIALACRDALRTLNGAREALRKAEAP